MLLHRRIQESLGVKGVQDVGEVPSPRASGPTSVGRRAASIAAALDSPPSVIPREIAIPPTIKATVLHARRPRSAGSPSSRLAKPWASVLDLALIGTGSAPKALIAVCVLLRKLGDEFGN